MKFGSLFSGIGGLDLGLERAGMRCLWQVERDPFRRSILAKHWPDVRRFDDVSTFPPDDAGGLAVDLICGGDPCQENSRARQGNEAVESSLGDEFIRIVDALRPRYVLRENPSRTRPDAPWPWNRFRSELESIGYVVLPFRFRACCAGAVHQRERVFLFAEAPDPMQEGLQGAFLGDLAGAVDSRIGAAETPGVFDAPGRDRRLPAPRICRGVDGIPDRMDRIAAPGDAVYPPVAEWIGRMIMRNTEPRRGF